ncbi:hypothetical protein CGRA01v4_09114 [Colletotrichum graminicola]|nr:hypothetical protein CGRA01v4_09114 [Colletotrichum graminicola]
MVQQRDLAMASVPTSTYYLCISPRARPSGQTNHSGSSAGGWSEGVPGRQGFPMTVIPTYHIPILSIPSITAHGKQLFSLQKDRIGSQSKGPFPAFQLVQQTRPSFSFRVINKRTTCSTQNNPHPKTLRNARNLNWEHISSNCAQPCDTNTAETEAGGSIPSVLLSEKGGFCNRLGTEPTLFIQKKHMP